MFGNEIPAKVENQQLLTAELQCQARSKDLGEGYEQDDWFELAVMDAYSQEHVTSTSTATSQQRRVLFESMLKPRHDLQQQSSSTSSAFGDQVVPPQSSKTASHVNSVKAKEQHCHASGSHQSSGHRSARSPMLDRIMAMLRETHRLGHQIQRLCPVVQVQGVTTSYIPREGCPGTHQHQPDPKMFALALNMLKADLGPHNKIPDKELVDHVMNMIRDEDALQALKLKMATIEESLSASKSIYRMQVQQLLMAQAPSTSSKTSKDSVQDMRGTLTVAEKEKLLLGGGAEEGTGFAGGGSRDRADPASTGTAANAAQVSPKVHEIENVTKMGNLSLDYAMDDEEIFEEPYGRPKQLPSNLA